MLRRSIKNQSKVNLHRLPWHYIALTSLFTIAYAINSPPVFNFKRDITVSENEPNGSRITTVYTRDDNDDIITYSLAPSSYQDGSRFFRIDSRTGDVYLQESLSGKGKQTLYMFVQAYDGTNLAKIEVLIRVIPAGKGNVVTLPPNHQPRWKGSTGEPLVKPHNVPFISRKPEKPERPKLPVFNNHSKPIETAIDQRVNTMESATESDTLASKVLVVAPYVLIACFVPFAGVIIWIVYHKCQRSSPTRNAIKTFSHKIINNNKSASMETTMSSFASELDYSGALFQTKRSLALNETANANKSLLNVTDSEWEFPRHHLRFMHILGQGCFGQVWKCETVNTSITQVVAVKTLKENATEKERKDLLEELEVMKVLDPHPNVVTLVGSCTERDPVLLIMEYVPYGKLQKLLQNSREELYYGGGGFEAEKFRELSSHDLVSFAYQVAKGMEYLSSKGIIHRDLAARNILVGNNKVCKIADFGLAKYNQEIYERKSEGRLPIRWMAVESLTDFVFTTKSDVWSFGILMWEIVTLACTPYPGMTATEVIKKVCDGYRLEKPEHCKREMYNIMYYCWERNPNKRPSFSELVCLLDNLLYSDNQYIELDRFPNHAYYNILKPENAGEKL